MIPYWRLSGYYFFYFAFVGAFSPYFSLYLQSVGSTAAQIADHCGISVAEAELVCALARAEDGA